ncbi:MAG: hypothetical protein ACLRZG_04745 [Streptococcus sp.]
MIITSQSFDIKDDKTNESHCSCNLMDKDNKRFLMNIRIIRRSIQDTHGRDFYFYCIDFKKHPQQGEIPVDDSYLLKTTSKLVSKVLFAGVDGNLMN